MTDQVRQLVFALRRQLPAPISLCRDAIVASGGDLEQARRIVVGGLTRTVIDKTGMTDADAENYLETAGFDAERAIVLWFRDNPPPNRLSRVFTQGLAATLKQLECWGVTEDMLDNPINLDSCLLNNPIEGYLDDRLPHLGLDDA